MKQTNKKTAAKKPAAELTMKQQVNTLLSIAPGALELPDLKALMTILQGESINKSALAKIEKFNKQYPAIKLSGFEFDADKKMSEQTRHTILHIVLDVMNYFRGSDFVDYLQKSNRIEYLIDNLLSNQTSASSYADSWASLRDFYADYVNGDTSDHEPEHRISPKSKKK